MPYLYKKMTKSRLSDPFYGEFWSFLSLGAEFIYEVKSAILVFERFFICLYKSTLSAIDIDNIGCLEPFLPL